MRRVLLGVVLALTVSACSTPAQQQQWGQGQETAQGYQEPAHGFFYYYFLYHATLGLYQPTVVYHVYAPPYGYPATYRPWYPSRDYVPTYRTPYRAGTPSTATPARTSGGFAAPARPETRSTGGFAPKAAAPPTPSRTSGGFASRPPSTTRSSGGFSRPRK